MGRGTRRNSAQVAAEVAWCFDRRIAGFSIREISDASEEKFGYVLPQTTVFRRITSEIEARVQPGVEALREIEVARLDSYLKALAPKIEAGNDRAVQAAVRVSERRARLTGADAPIKVAGEHVVRYEVVGVDPAALT